jgi:hypothetical protein
MPFPIWSQFLCFLAPPLFYAKIFLPEHYPEILFSTVLLFFKFMPTSIIPYTLITMMLEGYFR